MRFETVALDDVLAAAAAAVVRSKASSSGPRRPPLHHRGPESPWQTRRPPPTLRSRSPAIEDDREGQPGVPPRRPPRRPARSWPSLSARAGHRGRGPAADGRHALSQALDLGRTIVLTDIEMPRMTGLELAAELARQDRSIRVIVLTTFGRPRGACAGRWTPPQPATR